MLFTNPLSKSHPFWISHDGGDLRVASGKIGVRLVVFPFFDISEVPKHLPKYQEYHIHPGLAAPGYELSWWGLPNSIDNLPLDQGLARRHAAAWLSFGKHAGDVENHLEIPTTTIHGSLGFCEDRAKLRNILEEGGLTLSQAERANRKTESFGKCADFA